jgi:hypothetical protein
LRLLALDQSIKRTGWTVIEASGPLRPPKVIGRGWFGVGGAGDERAKVARFVQGVRDLAIDYEPVEALVWEKPTAFVGTRGVNARTLLLTRLDEALHQFCADKQLRSLTAAASTWRAKVLGKGAGRLSREEAKQRAVQYCEWIGLPCSNDDEAEAICIGMWACAYGRLWEQVPSA